MPDIPFKDGDGAWCFELRPPNKAELQAAGRAIRKRLAPLICILLMLLVLAVCGYFIVDKLQHGG